MDFEAGRVYNFRDSYYIYDGYERDYWRATSAVKFDVDMLTYGDYGLKWYNNVHGEVARYQYRSIGWQWRLELDAGKVGVYWDHHSQHLLDAESYDRGGYPLRDSYGARFTLYNRGKK